MQISRIRLAECPLPLLRVLRLGPIEISTRDYVAIRIETNSGLAGEAIGYTRGTPLFETLLAMSPRIVGQGVFLRRKVTLQLEESNAPGRAALSRGLSLLDIALWDIAAKSSGQPLFQLLGGFRESAPVTVVAGYYIDQRSISDVAEEAARLSDDGFRRIKIMLKGNDHRFDEAYVAELTKRFPDKIAADAHWSWSSLTEARRACRVLDDLGLSFLEDPFPAFDVGLTHQLRRQIATPIAAGEDVCGSRAISNLASGVDILRVDATTCGGVTGAIEAIHLASGAGRTVLPHVFSPLHVHLACAFPNVEGVEIIPENAGTDPVGKLMDHTPLVENGELSPSLEPGLGLSLNWVAIERHACKSAVVPSKAQ